MELDNFLTIPGKDGPTYTNSTYQNMEGEMKYEAGDYVTHSGSWLLSFFLGGVVGAAVALLLAPKSGRQTRGQIKDIAHDYKEKAEGYYDQAKSKMSTVVQKGTEIIHRKGSGNDSASEVPDSGDGSSENPDSQ
jgi:gas vesicle protein